MSTKWDDKSWQKKLLERRKFNDKFLRNLLEHGAKNIIQGIYFGYICIPDG